MKKIFILLTLIFTSNSLLAQDSLQKLPKHKLTQEYTVLVNGSLSSIKMFDNLNTKKITNIEVLTIEKNDNYNFELPNLSQFGIVKINSKKTFNTKTQRELNISNNLKPENHIYYDGFLIDNKKIAICLNAIVEIEIIQPSAKNKLETEVINIWTLTIEQRFVNFSTGCSLSNIITKQ